MMGAVIWLVIGLVLICAELLSGQFVLLMLGGGAFVAAAAAALGVGALGTTMMFGAASVLLLGAVRPLLYRRLHRGLPAAPMHTAALLGGSGVVLARVDGTGGRIKIGGAVWSAKALNGVDVIEPGQEVTVVTISGATAMVVARS